MPAARTPLRLASLIVAGAWLALADGVAAQERDGTGDPTMRAELRLRPDRRIDISFFMPPDAPLWANFQGRVDRGEATRTEDPDGAEVAWSGLSESEAVGLLLEVRAVEEDLSVRILMSSGVAFDDIWELQNVLTQAGIRRVRFVSGVP